MYKLASGIKIDDGGIIEAMMSADTSLDYCFDSVTGQVGTVKTGKKLDKKRYFKIPKIPERKKISWAKSYVKELMCVDDPKANVFLETLKGKKGGFAKFYNEIQKTDEKYGWPQWEHDHAWEEMENWMDTLPFDIEDYWEWDCDCSLCQAEHFREKFGRYPNPDELFEFMEAQKNKNN